MPNFQNQGLQEANLFRSRLRDTIFQSRQIAMIEKVLICALGLATSPTATHHQQQFHGYWYCQGCQGAPGDTGHRAATATATATAAAATATA